jgi:hypothetical protein
MQPEIPVPEPDHGHPDGQRHAKDMKRTAVDDPDTLGDGLEAVQRRVGAIGPCRARHDVVLLLLS